FSNFFFLISLPHLPVPIVASNNGPTVHKTTASTPPTINCQQIGFARTAEYAAASPGINPNQIARIIKVFSAHSGGSNFTMCDESGEAPSPGTRSNSVAEIFASRKMAN